MIASKFNHAKDIVVLNKWLSKRGHETQSAADLPKNGYMIYEEDEPVCCAFLRLCEGNFGMLDGLATNPEAESDVRNIAIDAVVHLILADAKRLKMNSVLSWTIDKSTLLRSAKHGFERSEFVLITKNLKEERGLTQ